MIEKNLMISRIVVIVAMCLTTSACMSVKYGSPIVIDGLNDLVIGQSSRADMLLALGQPRGSGSMSSIHYPDSRDIMFYEYLTSDGSTVELEIMTVFLHNDLYDGHLWFASSDRMRREGGIPYLTTPEKVEAGDFPDLSHLESSFVRGQSTRDDVLAILDTATGVGSALLPPDHRRQDVWFYQDMEITDIKSSDSGEYLAEMNQRILLVMFYEGLYDGFMWYSNMGSVEGRSE